MGIGRLNKNSKLDRIGNNHSKGFSFGQVRGDAPPSMLGQVTITGDYKLHAFTSSVPTALRVKTSSYNRSNVIAGYSGTTFVEYLVVGGGGGGYGDATTETGQVGGGGGAGGMLSNHPSQPAPTRTSALDFTPLSLQGVGICTIVVGSGGAVNAYGNASTFDTPVSKVEAIRGGRGSSGPGGSGGGGGWPGGGGGTGTSGQGNAGGGPARSAYYPSTSDNSSGGGGGAGGAGSDGISGGTSPGNGGGGISNSISGTSVTYCGGGGGGGTRAHYYSYGRPHDPITPYPGGYGGAGGNSSTTGGRGGSHVFSVDATPGQTYGSGGGGGSVKATMPAPVPNPGTSRGAGTGADGIVYIRYQFKGL